MQMQSVTRLRAGLQGRAARQVRCRGEYPRSWPCDLKPRFGPQYQRWCNTRGHRGVVARQLCIELRLELRARSRSKLAQRVAAGDSDSQILTSLESVYGPTILLSPATGGLGVLLWLAPAGAGLVLLLVGWRLWRRRA